jgi:signal transduction histidine kinase
MSAEGIASLFQPFTRLDEDQPDNPSGAGLGLAFVQTVAERHHGTISVNSREGEGTEFILRFPAADIQAHQSTR